MTEYSQFYDAAVPDWPGEIDFYQGLAREVAQQHGAILEVACGTGRVGARLAQAGVRVVGLDRSADLLAGARAKTADLPNARWVEGDMRTFDLGETFALIIMPGHSYQFMLTPADQVACLQTIQRHLAPGGRFVLHLDNQNVAWLGELRTTKGGQFELTKELTHPHNGRTMQVFEAWTYDPVTQTAAVSTRREIRAPDGQLVELIERGPTALHCIFPFEMEHLLARVGFQVEARYGDFAGGALSETSSEMIWIASM